MYRMLAGAAAVAVAAAGLFSSPAQAAPPAHVCQWTGHDWACGDGNVFTRHYPAATGPDMVLSPVPAPNGPPGQPAPLLAGPRPY